MDGERTPPPPPKLPLPHYILLSPILPPSSCSYAGLTVPSSLDRKRGAHILRPPPTHPPAAPPAPPPPPSQKNIICPNKQISQGESYYKGHLLESETYIGGKVEAIESGVFRSDLPLKFKLKAQAYQVGGAGGRVAGWLAGCMCVRGGAHARHVGVCVQGYMAMTGAGGGIRCICQGLGCPPPPTHTLLPAPFCLIDHMAAVHNYLPLPATAPGPD